VGERDHISVGLESGQLDQNEAARFVSDPRAGAISVFAGVTRAVTDDRETLRLEYDAYPDMAEKVLGEIAVEVAETMHACRIYIRHRIGEVDPGEASVLIAVSSPHRPEAFKGCRYIIDQLKQRVPIWKKEHYTDGTNDWVEAESTRAKP
jgi:molybdopterin synthase catalytic subunit